jgi:hypothetical protein
MAVCFRRLASMNFLKLFTRRKVFFSIFLLSHVLFSYLLGPFYGLAPDETGYIYTLTNLYGNSPDQNPQLGSGWIATSKPFLWLAYLPAHILISAGIPAHLAIRLLSILFGLVTLILLDSVGSRDQMFNGQRANQIHPSLFFFFVPSIFLWQSLGLRESFLLLEITMVLVGLHRFIDSKKLSHLFLAGVGSFGLLATKNYQWIFLILALLFAIGIQLVLKKPKAIYLKAIVAVIVLPAFLYATTTSAYALAFFVRADIQDIAKRSGDSISIVTVTPESETSQAPQPAPSKTTKPESETSQAPQPAPSKTTKPESETSQAPQPAPSKTTKPESEETATSELGTEPSEDLVVRVHGDSTTISLYRYLQENKQSFSSKLISRLGVTGIVEREYESLVSNAILNVNKTADRENKHILEPGTIGEPLKLLKSIIAFTLGPVPLDPDYGLFLKIISLESPFWWVLVGIFLYLLRKKKSFKFVFHDLPVLLASTYLGIVIVTSAMTEVNLGTSFRHRSLILIPIVFICIRLAEKKSAGKPIKEL